MGRMPFSMLSSSGMVRPNLTAKPHFENSLIVVLACKAQSSPRPVLAGIAAAISSSSWIYRMQRFVRHRMAWGR